MKLVGHGYILSSRPAPVAEPGSLGRYEIPALLLVLILTSCGHKAIIVTDGSPQKAVVQYYEAARKGDVEKANSYLSSYDHKKLERYPENRTVGIEYVKKHSITPRIDGVQTKGRFSAVAIVYKDPRSQRGDDRMEYVLVASENDEWKLVMTSRPYIDPADWKISAEEEQNIQALETWYKERKKRMAFAANWAAAAEKESPQVTAVRSMHSMLAVGKYEEFYRDWCHPHLQQQLSSKEFVEWMKSDKGKADVQLFADVVRAIDTKAGPDVLIAQAQKENDQYEFILVATSKQKLAGRSGAQWHLEIQLHEGKWKLMDTD